VEKDLDVRLDLETPEQVVVSLPLAGVGSRMAAYGLDLVVRLALSLFVVIPAVFVAHNFPGLGGYVIAGAILGCLLLHFFYYVYFEVLHRGQTPGKRRLGLRTVKLNGTPVDFLSSVLRNVLRVVDWLPAGYGLGIAVMFFAAKEQRIGDVTAGTVVVREKRSDALSVAGLDPDQYEQVCRDLGIAEPGRIRVNLAEAEADVLARYLARLPGLNADRAQSLGERIASGVRERVADPDGTLLAHLDDPDRREGALRIVLQRHLLTRQGAGEGGTAT